MGLAARVVANVAKRFRRGMRRISSPSSQPGQVPESSYYTSQHLGEDSVLVATTRTEETPCLVQHAHGGHYVSTSDTGDVVARRLQEDDYDSFGFHYAITCGFDSRHAPPYDKVLLFSFWSPPGEKQQDRQYLIYDATTRDIAVQDCQPIQHNMTELSTEDPRFFIHDFQSHTYDVLQVLQYPGLYLACRGSDLFLKRVSPDQLNQDKEIHFRIKYPPIV